MVGIMEGMVDITAEAISTEVGVSLSADIMGTPITIRTGIILTLIITRHLITILINRMSLPNLPPSPAWNKTPIGNTARIPKGITHTSEAVRVGGRGWFRLLPSREKKEGNMNWKAGLLVLFTVVVLSGCATMPTGPTVRVMPSPGKPYEVFMADEGVCREWAQYQIGGTSPSQTANENLAAGAVVGTVVGAGLGALIGAATGNAGAGAAIGAGAGLLGGTSIGANEGAASGYQLQRRYDLAYQQCMYAKGNQIPGVVRQPARAYAPPPPSNYYPPPPERSQAPPLANQNSGGQMYIYPRQGQSEEKQNKDFDECHSWAVGQTGFDPSKPPDGAPDAQTKQKSSDYLRAISACLDGRGYTLR
jgi:hypothetical protein